MRIPVLCGVDAVLSVQGKSSTETIEEQEMDQGLYIVDDVRQAAEQVAATFRWAAT